MFDIFLEKCVKKVRYLQSEFENRASIVNTRSMSRDIISWHISLTFHVSVPSQTVCPALTEIERNVTSFIRRSLPLNNMISISESELHSFNAHDATITLKVDVESTSIVFTKEILPLACMRTWADSESEVSMIGAEIQSVTFELPNGNCSNMTDRVTLEGSIFEYNNGTLNEDEVANITLNPLYTFAQFMSKSCYYDRESSNLPKIDIEIVMCVSKSDENEDAPFTCANGVILKLTAEDFVITEGVLVVDSSIYPEDQFVLSDDQSYAYICHINQKVASFWNTRSKTRLKQLLTLIGCILSIVCLVVSIITICAFKQMRNRPGKIILNLAIALVTAQLLFITVMDVVQFPWLCKIAAIFSHYFWLSTFCWMSVMATDIIYMRTQLTGHISGDGKVFVYYCLYAWLLPFVFVAICVIMDYFAPNNFQIGYSEGPICWIGRLTSLVVTFLVPVGLILLYNTICFLYTIWSMFTSERKMKHHRQKSYTTEHVIFSIKMSTVMGLTWIIGFLDGFLHGDVLDYIFIVANTLQGVFIFLAFLVRLRTAGLYYNACCRKVKENQTASDMHHFTNK
ncbi:adhesion G protein-coupled receptor E1-like [Ptychodera flava]|uniref:adhesion G protein-coupled receptor E1-like n=1 Tax=Ptychodera flava TaxID=63121 RepID=UPI003969ED6D